MRSVDPHQAFPTTTLSLFIFPFFSHQPSHQAASSRLRLFQQLDAEVWAEIPKSELLRKTAAIAAEIESLAHVCNMKQV